MSIAGSLPARRLKDVAVVVGLHKLSPVGRRAKAAAKAGKRPRRQIAKRGSTGSSFLDFIRSANPLAVGPLTRLLHVETGCGQV